ncbi:A disintegrin and metalloproteinase with thrombospondin motifs 8-like isoform X2 [Eucyclogobius newberryi]|uniref:A disintegrin and metalloproteinase with thrombospondin motifs 8-like isoform X2 n=1 Tax=Eucyclogobius newberryi TaxID=166745 RepID=UPI003B5BB459
MCSPVLVLFLCLCVTNGAQFESEDVVPHRIDSRLSGRFWKRSEEQPRFVLSAFSEDLRLNLIPDTSFLSPHFSIQRIRSGVPALDSTINRTEESEGHLRSCFYSGKVDGDPGSVVALSLCAGIHGSFITHGKEYFIEPKRRGNGGGAHSAGQTHVIRRRAVGSNPGLAALRFDRSAPAAEETAAAAAAGKEESGRSGETLTHGSGDARGQMRRRRFVSAPRFIETLVVADASMTHFYGDEIKHYILSLMSMAAHLYKHPSIKNQVNVVVVKMLVVEDEEVGPAVSSIGGITLRNFCSWQQLFNPPSQRHPEHYDTAMLFTRVDICGHNSCDTLGVADTGTMCDLKRSCSVIEDSGLQAAFTVAHELGHVLSMPHDDSKTCEKLFGDLGGHHLMAPLFVSLNRSSPWSPCSALHITEFFDSGHGDCLLDLPENAIPLPQELPGLKYSLDQQCQQIFGEEFSLCPNMTDSDLCTQLWCQEDGTTQCTTRNGSLPWADGTKCSENGACLNGLCTPNEEVVQMPVLVDGGWNEWGPWQQCSKTCGGGVEFSYRECTDPIPQNGGKYCEGQRVQYQSCNIQPCENSGVKSFREEQCEKYNSPHHLDFNGNVKQWIPKYAGVSPRDRCKLSCRAKGSNEFKVFESKVVDGTTCGPDTTSVCVQGQCVKAGCDQVIGSNKRVDKCGICGGDGLSCRKITGSYNKAIFGYNDIVTIPVGATNIDVKQRSHRGLKHDGNYLAVKRESGGYILNGNFSVSTVEQDIPVHGAVLKYSGSSTSLERIQSFRQLKETITVQLLATGGDDNPPKVKYSFYIPRDTALIHSKSKDKKSLSVIHPFGIPEWVLGEWSECSKSCGSGWSRRTVECRDNAGFLSGPCEEPKPVDIKACGDLPCPMWHMGPWSSCSRTCGQGERRRTVVCIDYTGKTVELDKCDANKIPEPVSGDCFNPLC